MDDIICSRFLLFDSLLKGLSRPQQPLLGRLHVLLGTVILILHIPK